MNPQTSTPDPVFSRICEVSARLMGGAVHRSTMKELQKVTRSNSASYPWETVVDRVLSEQVGPAELTKMALKSQRDWIVRGGRETPGPRLRHQAKSFVAKMLARLIFMAILITSLVILLVVCKLCWPAVDIYAANDWLSTTWPSAFGPK